MLPLVSFTSDCESVFFPTIAENAGCDVKLRNRDVMKAEKRASRLNCLFYTLGAVATGAASVWGPGVHMGALVLGYVSMACAF